MAIGNPSIAGVSVQNDHFLFVTGRSYGTTNLVVVGRDGRVLYSGRVVVIAGRDRRGHGHARQARPRGSSARRCAGRAPISAMAHASGRGQPADHQACLRRAARVNRAFTLSFDGFAGLRRLSSARRSARCSRRPSKPKSALRRFGQAPRGRGRGRVRPRRAAVLLADVRLAEVAMIGFAQTSLDFAVTETGARKSAPAKRRLGGVNQSEVEDELCDEIDAFMALDCAGDLISTCSASIPSSRSTTSRRRRSATGVFDASGFGYRAGRAFRHRRRARLLSLADDDADVRESVRERRRRRAHSGFHHDVPQRALLMNMCQTPPRFQRAPEQASRRSNSPFSLPMMVFVLFGVDRSDRRAGRQPPDRERRRFAGRRRRRATPKSPTPK